MPLYRFRRNAYHPVVLSNDSVPSQLQSDRTAQGRFAKSNKLGVRFQPGQSGNPGGNHKHTPKITNAYAKLLKMTPEEIANFEPQNGAEVIAFRQFIEAIAGTSPLRYAIEITNRTEGPIKRIASVEEQIDYEYERECFELVIELMVEKHGCPRDEAALGLAVVNPRYRIFLPDDE